MTEKNFNNECLCGCGTITGAFYMPGHDARHVSNLLQLWKAGESSIEGAMESLPSAKLRDKFGRAVERYTEKHNARKDTQIDFPLASIDDQIARGKAKAEVAAKLGPAKSETSSPKAGERRLPKAEVEILDVWNDKNTPKEIKVGRWTYVVTHEGMEDGKHMYYYQTAQGVNKAVEVEKATVVK